MVPIPASMFSTTLVLLTICVQVRGRVQYVHRVSQLFTSLHDMPNYLCMPLC